MRKIGPSLLFVAAGLLLITGCRSRITGNEGNLEFSYVADDDIRNFNKPIAVGARLDLEVRTVGRRRPVEVQKVTSSDPGVLDAVAVAGSGFTLEGKGEGSAEISVEALDGEETLTDSVNMLARVPEVLKMYHTCDPGSTEALYLTSQEIWVPFELEMKNGQPVIGYGYHPITITPPEALTLDTQTKNQQYFELTTADTPQQATVASTLDDTTLTFTLVAPADIDGATLGLGAGVNPEVGEKHLYDILPTVGGRPVCQANTDFTVSTTTPEICTVREIGAPDSGDDRYQYSWVEIEGLATGTCTFQVVFTEGAGGAGATADFSLTVDP